MGEKIIMSYFKCIRVMLTLFVVITSNFSANICYGQRVAVSSDLLKSALLTPNIGVEVVLSNNSTISLDASYNSWGKVISNISLDHISIMPEYKFWFKRALYSHYLSVNMNYTAFDLRLNNSRYKGYGAAVGLGYGYSFLLGKKWNLVPNIGVGYGFCRKYTTPDLGERSPMKNIFGPMLTKFGLTLQYIIK